MYRRVSGNLGFLSIKNGHRSRGFSRVKAALYHLSYLDKRGTNFLEVECQVVLDSNPTNCSLSCISPTREFCSTFLKSGNAFLTRVELVASRLTDGRSNQLSYRNITLFILLLKTCIKLFYKKFLLNFSQKLKFR